MKWGRIHRYIVVLVYAWINWHSVSKFAQLGLDYEVADPNDPAIAKLLEQHTGWMNTPQKPAVNVQEELNMLNFCKFFFRPNFPFPFSIWSTNFQFRQPIRGTLPGRPAVNWALWVLWVSIIRTMCWFFIAPIMHGMATRSTRTMFIGNVIEDQFLWMQSSHSIERQAQSHTNGAKIYFTCRMAWPSITTITFGWQTSLSTRWWNSMRKTIRFQSSYLVQPFNPEIVKRNSANRRQ